MNQIILDCDTGIDDSLAIAYLCASSDVNLLGITTVYGNVDCTSATHNTLNVLNLLKQQSIPVYQGALYASDKASYQQQRGGAVFHGENGIGDVLLQKSDTSESDITAEDFILETAKRLKGSLTLIAIGPLTNISNALEKDRETMTSIGKIVIMGGAFGVSGNVNPLAEANISQDPEAARKVFESGIPIMMIGLDVTSRAIFSRDDFNPWVERQGALKTLYDITECYFKAHELIYPKWAGAAMHDVLAACVAVKPNLISTLALPITVGVTERDNGRTIINMNNIDDKKKWTTHVAYDLCHEAFLKEFFETIECLNI